MIKSFDELTVRNIADIISNILTHTKISEYLNNAGIAQSTIGTNKTDRIYYALKQRQFQNRCGNNVLALIKNILNPKRYNDETAFENDRTLMNSKLLGYIRLRKKLIFTAPGSQAGGHFGPKWRGEGI